MPQFSRRDFIKDIAVTVLGAMLPASVWSEQKQFSESKQNDTWQALRVVADRAGILFGAAVDSKHLGSEPDFNAAIARECNLIVPEWQMKWTTLRPQPGIWDFEGTDILHSFAKQNGMRMRGHPLIWHGAFPEWAKESVEKGQAEKLMKEHIETVVGRYRGKVISWDVVNEAIRPEDGDRHGLRTTPWFKAMGPDYIDKAFRFAASADPSARLVYNDYNMEYEGPKSQAILSLLRRLKDADVPIHAVGLQAHLWAEGKIFRGNVLRDFCREVSRMGLDILITEFDVRELDFTKSIVERDALVARTAESFLDIVFSECKPKEILTWGLSDRHSWLAKPRYNPENPKAFPVRSLPLDSGMERKPVWEVIYRTLDAIN